MGRVSSSSVAIPEPRDEKVRSEIQALFQRVFDLSRRFQPDGDLRFVVGELRQRSLVEEANAKMAEVHRTLSSVIPEITLGLLEELQVALHDLRRLTNSGHKVTVAVGGDSRKNKAGPIQEAICESDKNLRALIDLLKRSQMTS